MELSQIKKIIQLGRFQFIFGGLLLFSFGALLALLLKAEFHLNQLILGYAIFITAHLSLHYSNDYFDVEVDKHNPPTTFTGGSGILVENPELREFSKWFAIVLTSLSVLLTIIFMIIFSFPLWFLLFVILSNLLVWFYSAPPLRLIDRGL